MKLRTNWFNLLCRIARHRWRATHVAGNLPTREECRRCKLTREVKSEFVEYEAYGFDKGPTRIYWWVYSDGRREPDERIVKHAWAHT